MRFMKYRPVQASDDDTDEYDVGLNAEYMSDRALLAAFLVTTFSLALSLSLVARWPSATELPTPGVLRRPNPYMGLDRVVFAENVTFPPISTYPRSIFQITNTDPSRALREDDRQWMSKFGTVVPEDYHFVATVAESSIIQFRSMDWGFERCVLHLRIPSTISEGRLVSSINIWQLDGDGELVPHITWKHAPRRHELVASRDLIAGQATSAIEFHCPSGSFPTFEFECSQRDPECFIDFWQDASRSADTGVYLVQHWSRGSAGQRKE